MDYSQYEDYGFERVSAFNLSTGYRERSYQAHWHSYGEILLVGPGKTNIFMVNREVYELSEASRFLINRKSFFVTDAKNGQVSLPVPPERYSRMISSPAGMIIRFGASNCSARSASNSFPGAIW